MKKIIFIFFLFVSCYIVYELTDNDKLYYMSIGDGLSQGVCGDKICFSYSNMLGDYLDNHNKLLKFNNSFSNRDYRITDITRMIEYNDYVYDNDKMVYINEALNDADILTISIGNNELYYKILMNSNDIYSYVNYMLDDISTLFSKISKYDYQDVLVTGFYNAYEKNNDVFTYLNYHLKLLTDEFNFTFVDISFLSNNLLYFDDIDSYYPNLGGYKKIFEIMVDKIENS